LRLRRRRCFLRRGLGQLGGCISGLGRASFLGAAEESAHLRGKSAGRRTVDRESSVFVPMGRCSIANGTQCVRYFYEGFGRDWDIWPRSAICAHLALRRNSLRGCILSRYVDGELGLSRHVVLDRRERRCRLVLVSRRAV
jgi:hypothetical protein